MLFAYAVRSLVARRSEVVPSLLVIAATVGATSLMVSLLDGLISSFRGSAQPRNAIVMTSGALEEAGSAIPVSTLAQIQVLPGIAKPDDAVLASPELVLQLRFQDRAG